MHSIRTKITVLTVGAVIATMIVAAALGMTAIRNIGKNDSNQLLLLLCESGAKNLDSYFDNVEQSVKMVTAYVESDLDGLDDQSLQAHLDRVSDIFKKMTYKTNGILTYYYRIDPKLTKNVTGFWYVNNKDEGFKAHKVTDITKYDTDDTSQLVWFTIPKATGKPVWLPPYITDTLEERVISYNVPIYKGKKFVGVVGIELDYSEMAKQVDNIKLYESGYAFVNEKNGNIVYHPDISPEELEKNHPIVPKGMIGKNKFFKYSFGGVEKQAVWLPLSNGARLNVTVPVSEINEEWHKWMLEVFIIFLAILAVIVFVIMRFTGNITKPLRDLTNAAKQFDEGNYDVEIEYDADDEVGILANTFNNMAAHLKTYIGDLNDLAYADALTSVRNKGAFDIYTQELDKRVDANEIVEFAVCIFDCNGLKEINDNCGHEHGDIYIKTTCSIICEVFLHSPVFRTGGDEFATILQNNDFKNRDELMRLFDQRCAEVYAEGEKPWEKVDIARGIAVYEPARDKSVDDVIRRADRFMYINKRYSKSPE